MSEQQRQQTALAHLAELHFQSCKRCHDIVNAQVDAQNDLSKKMEAIFKAERLAAMVKQ